MDDWRIWDFATGFNRVLCKYYPVIVKKINPMEILPHLPSLSTSDQQEIKCVQRNDGEQNAVQKLKECLLRKGKTKEFIEALQEVGFKELADGMVEALEIACGRQPDRSQTERGQGDMPPATSAERGQGDTIMMMTNCNVQVGHHCHMSVPKSGDSLTDDDMSSLDTSDSSLTADASASFSEFGTLGSSGQPLVSPDTRSGQLDVSPGERSGQGDINPNGLLGQRDRNPARRSGQIDSLNGRSGQLDMSPDRRSGQPHTSPDGKSGQPHVSPDGRSGLPDMRHDVKSGLPDVDIEQGHTAVRWEADLLPFASVEPSDCADTEQKARIETTPEPSLVSTQENLPVEVSMTSRQEEGDLDSHEQSSDDDGTSGDETELMKPRMCNSVETDNVSSLTESNRRSDLIDNEDRCCGIDSYVGSVFPPMAGERLDHRSGLDSSLTQTPPASGDGHLKMQPSTVLSDVSGDHSVLHNVGQLGRIHPSPSDVQDSQCDISLAQGDTDHCDVSLVKDNTGHSEEGYAEENQGITLLSFMVAVAAVTLAAVIFLMKRG